MNKLCGAQNEERKGQEAADAAQAAAEAAKVQEKYDMDLAAKYVQKKWNWYQTEGKLLAKKRKGKKGKKGKKKK